MGNNDLSMSLKVITRLKNIGVLLETQSISNLDDTMGSVLDSVHIGTHTEFAQYRLDSHGEVKTNTWD